MSEVEKPSIVQIFEHYGLTLIGADRGGWRKAQCPLPTHEDNNPSAAINEDGEKWHCHACDQGGDGYDIIMERDLVGFAEAKRLASRFLDGIAEPTSDSSLSLRPRRNRGYRNVQAGAPWLKL